MTDGEPGSSPGLPATDIFGPEARFHHVGLAVRSIEEAASGIPNWEDPIQRVRVGFLDMHGAPIEFVEPVGDRSPVTRSLEKGQKLLHLCFEVPDLDAALRIGAERGFRALGPPAPAVAFGGRRICWVFSSIYGLVELLEGK
jgi:methylmalonyl-CoA/ethylmalonyl-CoA epimerase